MHPGKNTHTRTWCGCQQQALGGGCQRQALFSENEVSSIVGMQWLQKRFSRIVLLGNRSISHDARDHQGQAKCASVDEGRKWAAEKEQPIGLMDSGYEADPTLGRGGGQGDPLSPLVRTKAFHAYRSQTRIPFVHTRCPSTMSEWAASKTACLLDG